MTKSERECPLKYPMKLNEMLVTTASMANPFRYSNDRRITAVSLVNRAESASP